MSSFQKVYALGETTFDIIFRDGRPVDSKAGGSVLNTSVSLGRLGVPVCFVASCGSDPVGNLTQSFLKENKVDTSMLNVFKGSSRVALAFLDHNNNAHYTFYSEQNLEKKPLTFPENCINGLVLFGSSFGIKPEIRTSLVQFLEKVRQSANIVFYDPNVRPSQLGGNKHAKDWIVENIRLSDIVKGSGEDFQALFGTDSAQQAYDAIKEIKPDAILLVTANKDGVDLFTPSFSRHYTVPRIKPVSTIGAGDTFSAGIIYGLYQAGTSSGNLQNISEDVWNQAVSYAINFATQVCLSYDNYIGVKDFNTLNINNQ